MTDATGEDNDERAIRDTITLYGMLLDDRRIDEWIDLFAPDAEFMNCKGHAQIVEAIVGGQVSLRNKHIACSSIVQIHGDTAFAWTDAVGMVDAGSVRWSRLFGQFGG